MESVPDQLTLEVPFTHAGTTRWDRVQMGWFQIRLPEQPEHPLWVAADDPHFYAPLVLLTIVALLQVAMVQSVYYDWRVGDETGLLDTLVDEPTCVLPVGLNQKDRLQAAHPA